MGNHRLPQPEFPAVIPNLQAPPIVVGRLSLEQQAVVCGIGPTTGEVVVAEGPAGAAAVLALKEQAIVGGVYGAGQVVVAVVGELHHHLVEIVGVDPAQRADGCSVGIEGRGGGGDPRVVPQAAIIGTAQQAADLSLGGRFIGREIVQDQIVVGHVDRSACGHREAACGDVGDGAVGVLGVVV